MLPWGIVRDRRDRRRAQQFASHTLFDVSARCFALADATSERAVRLAYRRAGETAGGLAALPLDDAERLMSVGAVLPGEAAHLDQQTTIRAVLRDAELAISTGTPPPLEPLATRAPWPVPLTVLSWVILLGGLPGIYYYRLRGFGSDHRGALIFALTAGGVITLLLAYAVFGKAAASRFPSVARFGAKIRRIPGLSRTRGRHHK